MIGSASRPRFPSEASSERKRRSSCSTGNLAGALVDEVEPLAGRIEGDAEIGADRLDETLDVADRLADGRRSRHRRALPDVRLRLDGLDPELTEHERHHERGRRERVADHDAEAARADRFDVERGQEILGIGLRRPRRVPELAHAVGGGAAELLAAHVFLDLLQERARGLDPGRLEDLDLHRLRVGRALPHVETGVESLRLQEVSRHRSRHYPQVGHVHAARAHTRDHRAADELAGGRRLAARHDPGAALQRGAEPEPDSERGLGRQVDVDEARDAVAAEDRRSRPSTPR